MKNKKKFLAIITARGGSKRLPKKNIKYLDNKPLITWTIEATLQSQYVDELIVSTDCLDIAEISKKAGANVPFMRPDSLAQDHSTSIDVVLHAIEYFKSIGQDFDYAILLQPTSPFRTSEDIDNAIESLFEKKSDAVISVCETEHNPIWCNTLNENQEMDNFLDSKYINARTQDLPTFYRLNGAIYICEMNTLIKNHTFFIPHNIHAYVMSQENSVDIDTHLDFLLANAILEQRKNNESSC